MMRTGVLLQLAILLTLLAGLTLNVEYWRSQRAFNESTLKRLQADEAILAACGCGAQRAFIAIAGEPRQLSVFVSFKRQLPGSCAFHPAIAVGSSCFWAARMGGSVGEIRVVSLKF